MNNNYGLQINKDVIAKIAGTAAIEVTGVVSIDSAPIHKNIKIKNPVSNSGIIVSTDNGAIIVDIYVNISQDAKVRFVAEEVQNNVKDKVQTMTGNAVAAVNVFISSAVAEVEDDAASE